MTIAITAYDTTAFKGSNVSAIENAIKAIMANDALKTEPDNDNVMFITPDTNFNAQVPAFVHPVTVTYKNETFIVADQRWYMTASKGILGEPARIRHETQYMFTKYRAYFNQIWEMGEPRRLIRASILPMAAFASWLTGQVNNRLRLDYDLESKFRILSAFFYYSQFTNEDKLNRADYADCVGVIKQAVRLSVDEITMVLDGRDTIKSLADFCDVVKEVLGSVRVKDLNPGLVVSMTGNGWFGINSNEIVPSALEHPPTWMALVLLMLTSSNIYRNCPIFRIVEATVGRGTNPKFALARAGGISLS